MKHLVLTLVLFSMGCAFDPICEPGEPECNFAEESIDAGVNQPDVAAPPDDNGSATRDQGEEPDTSTPQPDMPDPVDPRVCPAVETCGDEPDHFDKPVVWNEEYGCGARGFQSRTVSILDGLCGGDTDWHGFRIRPCRTRSFVVEATIEPRSPACLEWMDLDIANDDGFRLCGAEGARCELLPDGTLRASLLVQARENGGSSGTYFFVLDSTSETDAPYTITVSAFQ